MAFDDIEKEFMEEIIPDKQRSTRRKSINSKRKGKSAERPYAIISTNDLKGLNDFLWIETKNF